MTENEMHLKVTLKKLYPNDTRLEEVFDKFCERTKQERELAWIVISNASVEVDNDWYKKYLEVKKIYEHS